MAALACDAPTSAAPRIVRVDPSWVTGAAAAAVDPTTRLFVIAPSSATQLTRAGADSTALAAVRFSLNPSTFGNGRTSLEEDRGGPIAAFDQVRVCGRAMLVETPFGTPLAPAPRNLLRFMSSAWTHTVCGPRGDPQVAVHTVDVVTGVRYIGADWVITDLDSIGQVHNSGGIPIGRAGGAPWPSPEDVLKRLLEATGVPIAEVPRPQFHWYPIWRFTLSTAVEGLLDDGETSAPFTVVYARLVAEDSVEFFLPEEDQPTHVWGYFPASFDPPVIDSVQFPVTKPILFRRVRPQ
jgi:hypothetical protein